MSCEKYTGLDRLNYTSLDVAFMDSHRCGTSPFVPSVDGPEQHSCGSYCAGFDKKTGCNKFRPNYPDDDYIINYVKEHGNCDGLEDCKNCAPQIAKHDIRPLVNECIENFGMNDIHGMIPRGGIWTILYLIFLVLIARIVFFKK